MKKVDLLGWYGRKNVGDDAFQAVFSEWFKEHNVCFITPPNFTRPDADIVILGGGAVCSSYYLNQIASPNARRYAIGVDVEWKEEAHALASYGFDYLSFRSQEDIATFARHVMSGPFVSTRGGASIADYIPDLAFSLTPTGKNVIGAYKGNQDKRVIAVFLTDYLMPSRDRDLYYFGPRADQFCQGMAAVLDELAEKAEVILMPCSTGEGGNDIRVNLHTAAFMRHAPTIVFDRLSPVQMIDFIAGCSATICMRYHSHIFSIIAGTPFASIQFTKKVRTLINDYAPEVSRELVAVTRLDGYFEFDNTLEVVNTALVADSRNTEKAISLAYAEKCKKQVDKLKQMLLRNYL